MKIITKIKTLLLLSLALSYLESCKEEPKAVEEQRPNILFVIADDQSFPHAGAYGCTWIKTPGFDRVAKEGILFMNAYTANAKCGPSRASILTGRNSWQLQEAGNHWANFPEKFKSFPESMAENGYKVGRTGKGWAPGIAEKDGKPRELIGKSYDDKKLVPPTANISDLDYASNFNTFLEERNEEEPFLFWFGAIEPHRFYEFNSGIKKGGKNISEMTDIPPFWPENDSIKIDMLDYAMEIEHYDSHLEKMIVTLEKKGLLENTIIIVTSDNGMPFPRIKGQMYAYDNHLPLAIRWGEGIKNPGRRVEEYVNFVDFAPTFLELAGVNEDQSGMQPITGNSIFPLLKDEPFAQKQDFVLIGKERHDVGRPDDEGYPVRGIVQGDYAYTINFEPERWPVGNPETGYLNTDGGATKTVLLNQYRQGENTALWELNFGKRPAEELYHIKEDPFCMNNLAENPDLKSVKTELKETLTQELIKQGDPRMFGNGEIFDNYMYKDTATVDFYNRLKKGKLSPENAAWVNPSDFELTKNKP